MYKFPPATIATIVSFSGVWLGSLAPIRAQLVPDATLPSASIVTDTVEGQRITGGTRSGANLFHSFREFAIPLETRVEFADDGLSGGLANIAIERIFSRVTGEQAATIDGTLATPANVSFYLISPHGVIFGENARLAVGHDFGVTTGGAIDFEDGLQFGMEPIASPSLLSVGVPIGLGLGSLGTDLAEGNPSETGNFVTGNSVTGDIINRSRVTNESGNLVGLQVESGQSMEFMGHNILFEGGFATAIDGQIDLIATEAIAVTNSGQVNVSGETGGTITIDANTFATIDSSKVLADALSDTFDNGLEAISTAEDLNSMSRTGLISVTVDRLDVQNDALISTSTFGTHPGGTINVEANTVELTGTDVLENVLPRLFALEVIENPDQIGSGLFAMSLGAGNAGTINLDANDLSLDFSGFMSTVTTGAGNGGTLNVYADRIALSNSEIFADTYGAGQGGVVNLNADLIRLDRGGGIFASAFQSGAGGLVNVTADRIEIDGTTANGQFNSGIGSNVFSRVATLGGLVTIQAREIDISNGGSIGAGTFGPARGGTIILRASESITLRGVSEDGRSQSAITAQSRGTGAAGDIELTTGRLTITGGASVFTSALDAGPAGRLTVRATEAIAIHGRTPDGTLPSSLRSDAEISGAPSGFFAPSRANVVGAAGDMTVITPELTLSEGATLVASSTGQGEQAGNLALTVGRLSLDTGATIQAETAAATEGNIRITADTVQLRRRAGISGNATGVATGGSITIIADTVIGLENSDITANAQTGNGGQVAIDAAGVFGLTFREQLTPFSDITASSDLGLQSSGTVRLISPDIQFDQALMDIPDQFAGVDNVQADQCRPRTGAENNRFTINGRHSQPDAPDLSLRSEFTTITPRALTPHSEVSSPVTSPVALPSDARSDRSPLPALGTPPLTGEAQPSTPMLVEANTLVRTDSGYRLSLAQSSPTPHNTIISHGGCTSSSDSVAP